MKVSLVKYHGLGNDFLVALDPEGLDAGGELSPAAVARLCDRHRGVGADGVIAVRRPAADGQVRMELRNADGGRAETSGNGLRCLALALLDAGAAGVPKGGSEIAVETDAGLRRVALLRRHGSHRAVLRSEMGRVRLGAEDAVPDGLGQGWQAQRADAGNPHLVLLGPSIEGLDMAKIGPQLESAVPGGQNVEAASPAGDGLAMVVWERGAGLTAACGTGSCAVAAVARSAGIAADRVAVHNPGGTLMVDLSGDLVAPDVGLSGPAAFVARIEVDPDDLESGSAVAACADLDPDTLEAAP